MSTTGTTSASSNGHAASGAESPEELQARIEVQREQLAETLDALTEKLDVKAQARHKVAEVKAQARQRADQLKATTQSRVAEVRQRRTATAGAPRPELLGLAAAGVTAVVALVLWRRR